MKNFLMIAENVDVLPVVAALKRNDHLWDQDKTRTGHMGSAHTGAHDIILRFNDTKSDVQTFLESIICENRPSWQVLGQVQPIILDLMRRVGGTHLGRVVISRMEPGKCITPHVDGGKSAEYFERYQIALQSGPGVVFRIGDERVQFRTGDVWWIDNRVEHEVINNSADDRLALVVDIRS